MSGDPWGFLSNAEIEDIRVVLMGLLNGPWLEGQSAFWARLVYPREEVEPWVSSWPAGDVPPIVVRRALGEVVLGIRVSDEQWEQYFRPMSRQRAEHLYNVVKRHVDKLGNWIGDAEDL